MGGRRARVSAHQDNEIAVGFLVRSETARQQSLLPVRQSLPLRNLSYQSRRRIEGHVFSPRSPGRFQDLRVNRGIDCPGTIKSRLTKKLLQTYGTAIPGIQQPLLRSIKHLPAN